MKIGTCKNLSRIFFKDSGILFVMWFSQWLVKEGPFISNALILRSTLWSVRQQMWLFSLFIQVYYTDTHECQRNKWKNYISIRMKSKFSENGNGSILGFSSEGSHLIRVQRKSWSWKSWWWNFLKISPSLARILILQRSSLLVLQIHSALTR